MSWHFLQEQEEVCWPDHNLDGSPDALLRLIPTQENVSWRDKETDAWNDSQFGTTSQPSMDLNGKDQSTSLVVDSHVRTSLRLEREMELEAKRAVCGNIWRELYVRFDPISCGWKTHRCLWSEDLEQSSVTFPRWGMIADGVLWERITQEPVISETGSGYWPTPIAHNAIEGNYAYEQKRNTPTLASRAGGKLNPNWVEWLMGWPVGWTSLNPISYGEVLRWKIFFQIDESGSKQLETVKCQQQ